MTDNDIIKAMECCGRPSGRNSCNDCPLQTVTDLCCSKKMLDNALALINRQKAEIERLEGELIEERIRRKNAVEDISRLVREKESKERECNNEHLSMKYWMLKAKDARAEAIKEFAERLKERANEKAKTFPYDRSVNKGDIDRIAKEMVGEMTHENR